MTTFRLVDKLIEVQNPNSNELTIDPKAGTGMDDHTGKNGGAVLPVRITGTRQHPKYGLGHRPRREKKKTPEFRAERMP